MTELSETERQHLIDTVRRGFEAPPNLLFNREIGAPKAVHGLDGNVLYWIVPGFLNGKLDAMARVFNNGAIVTISHLPEPAEDVSAAACGMSVIQVRTVHSAFLLKYPDASIDNPILVCDGPVGREIWLIVIRERNQTPRRIFVNAGGQYEKANGCKLDFQCP